MIQSRDISIAAPFKHVPDDTHAQIRQEDTRNWLLPRTCAGSIARGSMRTPGCLVRCRDDFVDIVSHTKQVCTFGGLM